MSKPLFQAFAALLVVFAVGCGGEQEAEAPEPTYQGKTASEWIAISHDRHDGTRAATVDALSELKWDSDACRERLDELLDDPSAEVRHIVMLTTHSWRTGDAAEFDRYRSLYEDTLEGGAEYWAARGISDLGVLIAMDDNPDYPLLREIQQWLRSLPDEYELIVNLPRIEELDRGGDTDIQADAAAGIETHLNAGRSDTSPVRASLSSAGFRDGEAGSIRFHYRIWNESDRPIAKFRGTLIGLDATGTELMRHRIVFESDLQPGRSRGGTEYASTDPAAAQAIVANPTTVRCVIEIDLIGYRIDQTD